ncbi:bifunctional RNase H/acid phosphatase [Corynebacterium sp. Q4381]|uniref:bifunctional RNase H/acid phosphatase n=1 Tax=Corynebacterium sp. Marseille-Q4381 TaxID=3121597 RepID=UPI002FE5749C
MRVSLFCDGGSRGNPGVAGSGSVIYDDSGATLAEIAYVVGAKASNNVAEYYGLVRGLEAAKDLGATEVRVSMDSKLVVEQMNGRWKIKHPDMKQLALEARELAKGFERVTYTWVPRAKNKKADELSNVAMDAAAKDGTPRILDTPSAAPAASASAKPAAHQTASPAHWSGTDAPRTRFVLLRHGQTEHSAQKRFSGSSDPELTEVGRAQAKRAAEAIAAMGTIDAIVSSPKKRALETARYCADALGIDHDGIETVDGFREIDFGDLEGLTKDEAAARLGAEWEGPHADAPGGETVAALHRRVTRARLKTLEAHEGQTILVVTHMMPIKSVIRQALGSNAESFKHMFLDLASVSVVEFYGDYGVVRTFNDVAHHR